MQDIIRHLYSLNELIRVILLAYLIVNNITFKQVAHLPLVSV